MKKNLVTFLMLVLFGWQLSAQTKQISGTVTDKSEGFPLPGVSVFVKGSTMGTSTNMDGKYSLAIHEDTKVIVFTFVGMKQVEIPYKGQSIINVEMEADAVNLDEVIVGGYLPSTKQSFTGTATKVDSEKLAAKSTTNISQALAGEVAGVTVINTSGQPGTSSTIRIRGFGSVNGNRDPLYVVDGVPFSGSINSINQADIESTTILKDAAATAIYGSRGANGVIVITTKKGKAGKSQIEVDFKYGVNYRGLPQYDRITNQEEYMEIGWNAMQNKATIDKANNPVAWVNKYGDITAGEWASKYLYSDQGVSSTYNIWDAKGDQLIDPATGKFIPGVKRKYTPEDWDDEMFNTGHRTETNVRISGGVDKTTYSTSFGFLKDEGYSINSDYKRFTGRVDVGHQVKEWLKGSMNIAYTNSDVNNGGQSSATSENVFYYADHMPTIYPVYLRDTLGNPVVDPIFGGWQYDFGENGRGFGAMSNPVATANLDTKKTRNNEVDGNAYLEASFLKNFKLASRLGLQYNTNSYDNLSNPFYGGAANNGGSIYKIKREYFAYVWTQQLSYTNQFDLHNVEAHLFHETMEYEHYYLSTYKQELANPFIAENNNAVKMIDSGSYKNEYSLESYFGQLKYDFDNKYFATFTLRHDGSSRFKNDKWGTFWSFGVGWVASKESFMESVDWVDFLKVKLSYGVTGDQAGAGLYSGYDLYKVSNLNDKPSFGFTTKGNPDLTWETSKMFQIGTEFNIAGVLDAELDYYVKNTDDQFFDRRVGPSLGYAIIEVNDGKLQNRGFEFNLTGHVVNTNDFKLDLILNGEMLKNKMKAMPIDPSTEEQKILDIAGSYGRAKGHSLFDFYMREYAGVDPTTGLSQWTVHYTDKNNNGSYDEGEGINSLHEFMAKNPKAEISRGTTTSYDDATQKFVGKSAIPKVRGAFRIEAKYKGFELGTQFMYQFGGYGYDGSYASLMHNQKPGANIWHADMRDRWQNAGDITNIPRVSAEGDKNVNSTSTRFLTKSDYIWLNNVRLGYNFSERFAKKLGLGKLSVWVAGDNLWMHTERKGYNPTTSETGSSSSLTYSPLTTITGGIRVQF